VQESADAYCPYCSLVSG